MLCKSQLQNSPKNMNNKVSFKRRISEKISGEATLFTLHNTTNLCRLSEYKTVDSEKLFAIILMKSIVCRSHNRISFKGVAQTDPVSLANKQDVKLVLLCKCLKYIYTFSFKSYFFKKFYLVYAAALFKIHSKN